MKITLRPITSNDHAFLLKLYRNTREEELKRTAWSEEEKIRFIDFQYKAQHSFYTNSYKNADFNIIMLKNENIGRFYLWRTEDQIRIIDISLFTNYRRKGIGTFLFNQLISESEKTNKKITLHVLFNNPALKLYERLNFIKADYIEPNYYMERIPDKK